MSAGLTEKQATELAVVDEQIEAAIACVAAVSGGDRARVARAVALSRATTTICAAIKKHWGDIAPLKDTPYGFATDESSRKGGPYSPEQLQQALTHGILLGGLPTGGEITVISGRAYLSLPHFERWAREQEGLADLVITLGVPAAPQGDGGTALVEATASYTWHGESVLIEWTRREKFDGRIPVRVNAGMGPDAVLGKARRKVLAAIRRRVQGAGVRDDALEDDDGRTITGTVAAAPTSGETDADLAIAGKQYAATLLTLDEIGACGRLYDQYFGPDSAYYSRWGPAHRERGGALRDERIEQIRAARGPRSNGDGGA